MSEEEKLYVSKINGYHIKDGEARDGLNNQSIVESGGTDSDGYYIKFGNGVMIYYFNGWLTGGTIDMTTHQCYETVSFPEEFSSIPVVTITPYEALTTPDENIIITKVTPSTTGYTYRAYTMDSTTGQFVDIAISGNAINVIAIGTWSDEEPEPEPQPEPIVDPTDNEPGLDNENNENNENNNENNENENNENNENENL